jgi:hypothetical protein
MPPVELALLPFSEPTVRGATDEPVVGLSTATPVLVVPGVFERRCPPNSDAVHSGSRRPAPAQYPPKAQSVSQQ